MAGDGSTETDEPPEWPVGTVISSEQAAAQLLVCRLLYDSDREPVGSAHRHGRPDG